MATKAEIQAAINQIVTNANYRANSMRPLLTEMLNFPENGVYTPTIGTPTNSAVVTSTDLNYIKIDTSVILSGMMTIELEASSTSTVYTISLDDAILPDDDWVDTLQVNAVLSRRNGAFDGVCRILSYNGTKLLRATISDATAGAVVDISFFAMYATA